MEDCAARPPGRLAVLTQASRQIAGLTQRQLAARAGISLGALQDLEQGRTTRPRRELLARLAEALELSESQFTELAATGEGHQAPLQRRHPSGGPFPGLRLGVLGPLAVWRDGLAVAVGPVRERALLGLLALHVDTTLHRAEILTALWGGDPPHTSTTMIQTQVSRIRRLLAPSPSGGAGARLHWDGSGYRLILGSVRLDLAEFGELTSHARQAAVAGDVVAACEWYEQALRLWRGQALDDIDMLRGHPAVTRLDRWRDAVVLEYAATAAGTGRPDQVISHLEALAAREPLDERAHAQLMVTLTAMGRQADALRVYQDLAERLDSDLGIRPGPDLTATHLRVLRQQIPTAATPAGSAPLEPGSAGGPGLPAPGPAAPRNLPPPVRGFTGRATELAALAGLLEQACGPAGTVVIAAIGGAAGVGKTALAVYWAHQTAGRFPDGQLYVNLRGFGPSGKPVAAAEAIRLFLDLLGVPRERIPAHTGAQAALFRSLLAGKRMLLVLDNAREPEQVRPLLPGTPGSLVLVTSRNQLTGLAVGDGACLFTLDVLTEAEAHEMLAYRLGPQRAAGGRAAVAELVRLCARLPLALSITAARAAVRPRLPLAALTAELRDAGTRLDALGTTDAATDIRTVFSWSCQQLTAQAGRMFQLLGVHPGPDITVPAAASLAGLADGQARQALAELTQAHLMTEHAPGRFTFHDLLRAYAAEQASGLPGAERRAAIHRMLDHYLHTAYAASHLIHPYRDPIARDPSRPLVRPEELGGRQQAMEWFRAERQVLLAVISQAAAGREFSAYAWQLPWTAAMYFNWDGCWQELAATQQAALAASVAAGDRVGQAEAHRFLGLANIRTGAIVEGRSHLTAALELGRRLGSSLLQARAHLELGRACNVQGASSDALAHAEQALRLYRATGYRPGEASALNAAGWCCALLGRFQETLHYCGQSLRLHRELGNRSGEASTLHSLGYAHHHLGNHAEAVSHFQQAIETFGNADDVHHRAQALTDLGDAHWAAGHAGPARRAWEQALAILDDLHHPEAEHVRTRLRAGASEVTRTPARPPR